MKSHRALLWIVLGSLVACASERTGDRNGNGSAAPRDASPADPTTTGRPGASPPTDGGVGAGPAGAGDGGAAPAIACTTSSEVVVYPRVGAATDDIQVPQGPGLVLMGGGTDVDAAFVWMHDTMAGTASAPAGDLVVVRASGDNAYDAYAYALAPFQSVRTIVVGATATAADLACAAAVVAEAEGVFFAGGDQSRYVAFRGTPLMQAVQHVYDRGGVVGGTSAGCAILGEFVYDSLSAGATNVATADAIASPFEAAISFTRGMFRFPPLLGVITDPHFHPRDRMGRLASFMARQHADGAVTRTPAAVLGIGVDEKNAVVIDKNGIASLLQQAPGSGAAFFVSGAVPTQCEAGKPLVYRHLRVERLESAAQTLSLHTWCGNGTVYGLDVFGDAPPPYSPSNPYAAGADGTVCVP